MKNYKTVKRILDLWFTSVGLLFLAPIFVLLAAAVKLDSEGPVFFIQERIGKDGRPFPAYKFRSMVDKAVEKEGGMYLSFRDPRITPLGEFLRQWSLDELPQVINIFRGEMSLIGPRPTLRYQVEQYNEYQRKRLQVKPGITGWAQVNGRNALTWNQRIDHDVWYVENRSLKLDMKILAETVRVVLRKEGLYGAGGVNYDFVPQSEEG